VVVLDSFPLVSGNKDITECLVTIVVDGDVPKNLSRTKKVSELKSIPEKIRISIFTILY
jgi:hypothetical protein